MYKILYINHVLPENTEHIEAIYRILSTNKIEIDNRHFAQVSVPEIGFGTTVGSDRAWEIAKEWVSNDHENYLFFIIPGQLPPSIRMALRHVFGLSGKGAYFFEFENGRWYLTQTINPRKKSVDI